MKQMQILCFALILALTLAACSHPAAQEIENSPAVPLQAYAVIPGTEKDRDFVLDNVLQTADLGEIHFNLRVPDSYDGSTAYALHVALPGWEGLYFQGVGADLRWEKLPFASSEYVEDLIVASPQLSDWGDMSARQAVALTQYLLAAYNIDPARVYLSGYSGGGETLSLVMEQQPELYRSALFVSSQWDGDVQSLVQARVPLYLFTAEHDSYYGAEPVKQAWQKIRDAYLASGLTEEEIAPLLVLDIRTDAWFDETLAANTDRIGSFHANDYHGAGMLVAFDESVMNWVFR